MEEPRTAWTEKHGFSNDLRGLDHLGLESAAENIYGLATPGFTNLARRARYYALYCWIIYDYYERGYHEREDFTAFFRRREHAYTLACISHDHRPGAVGDRGIMGRNNAGKFWNSGEDPLDLSKSHIKSRLGGYGLYYRNAMQLAGLIYLAKGRGKLTESASGEPSGRALAEAFESAIEDTTYFESYRDEYQVPRSILEEYGWAACVCEMAGAKDGEVLRQALLQPNPSESDAAVKAIHLSRTKTLTLIFEALSESGGEFMDDMAWRDLLFYSSFSDGRPFVPPEGLADVALIWRMYQQRELHVYTLTTLWAELLEWLKELRAATLRDWVEELLLRVDLEQAGERFGLRPRASRLSEVTVQQLLDSVTATSGSRDAFEPNLTEGIRTGIDRSHSASESRIHAALNQWELDDLGERVGAGLWLSLVLYARTRGWIYEDPTATNLARTGGSGHWSVESFFREIDRRRDNSALDFLAWLYQNLVRQHLSVAMSKLPLDSFMLLYEDGALHYRASDEAQFTSDRYETMTIISRDLGWVEEEDDRIVLTPLGEKNKSEALRVLS